MKRRSFLKLAGGACTSALLGWNSSVARGGGSDPRKDGCAIGY